MTDTKISGLSELAARPADSDELAINDNGTSKRITVANLGAMFASASKASDTDKTCCTTLSDVTCMEFTPNVCKTYQVIMHIRETGDPGGDMVTSFSVPSGAESYTTTCNIEVGTPSAETLSGSTQRHNSNSTNLNFYLTTIVKMGSTPGDIKLQMAQECSFSTPSTISANSTMMVYQLD